MLATVYSCAVIGLDGALVEVDIARGLPAFKATCSALGVGSPTAPQALLPSLVRVPPLRNDALVGRCARFD